MTTYYPDSKGLTKADIQAVDEWMQKKNLLVVCQLNERLPLGV
jgi:dipeptidyl-peptidase-3